MGPTTALSDAFSSKPTNLKVTPNLSHVTSRYILMFVACSKSFSHQVIPIVCVDTWRSMYDYVYACLPTYHDASTHPSTRIHYVCM
jgi:hypothetical protein